MSSACAGRASLAAWERVVLRGRDSTAVPEARGPGGARADGCERHGHADEGARVRACVRARGATQMTIRCGVAGPRGVAKRVHQRLTARASVPPLARGAGYPARRLECRPPVV